jgi:uncharacterized membrane protein
VHDDRYTVVTRPRLHEAAAPVEEDAVRPPQRPRSQYVSRNVNELHDEGASLGDRLSDSLARIVGSWTFIIAFGALLVLWMGVNSLQLLLRPFDPFPYVFLNLILSCLAAIQAPVILMSQNRQAARDRLAAEQDYRCNLKAEIEVEQLQEKLDQLREQQWLELLDLQRRQISLLHQLLEQHGIQPAENGSGAADARPARGGPGRRPGRRRP